MQRARTLNGRKRSGLAEQQTERADRLIDSALQIILKEPVSNQRRKLKERIDEAEQMIRNSGNQKAKQHLIEAKELDSKAAEAFKTGQYQKALDHYRKARFSVSKAIELTQNEPSDLKIKAESEREQLDQLIRKAKHALQNSQNPDALVLFESSERQIRISQKEIEKANYQSAIDHYHKAARLLLRIIDIADDTDTPQFSSIHVEVAALDSLVDRVQVKLTELPQRKRIQSSALMNQIYEAQRSAHQNLDDGHYEAAQSDIRRARNLIERASQALDRKVINRSSAGKPGQLIQLDQRAKMLQSNAEKSSDKEVGVMLGYALEAIDQAFAFYRNNNAILAEAAIHIAEIYIKSAERMLNNPDAPRIDANMLATKLNRIHETIEKLDTIRLQLNPADKLRLNTAIRFFELAEDEYEEGNLRVAFVSLKIAEENLDNLTDK